MHCKDNAISNKINTIGYMWMHPSLLKENCKEKCLLATNYVLIAN